MLGVALLWCNMSLYNRKRHKSTYNFTLIKNPDLMNMQIKNAPNSPPLTLIAAFPSASVMCLSSMNGVKLLQ